MRKAFCVCAALAFGLCAFGAQKMTDRELDALVDRYVQCEHADFVQASIDELKAEGCLTEPELAEAFYRGIDRFKAKTVYDRSGRLCLDWFKRTASDVQIRRLKDLALSCDGEFGRRAVWFYFDRMAGRDECLAFLDDVLRMNQMARDMVWRRLYVALSRKDGPNIDADFREKALRHVEKRAEEPLNAWYCDDILCRYRKGYAESVQRRERLVRLLAAPGLDGLPKVKEYFRREMGRLGTSEK